MIIPNIWKNKIHVPVTTNQRYHFCLEQIRWNNRKVIQTSLDRCARSSRASRITTSTVSSATSTTVMPVGVVHGYSHGEITPITWDIILRPMVKSIHLSFITGSAPKIWQTCGISWSQPLFLPSRQGPKTRFSGHVGARAQLCFFVVELWSDQLREIFQNQLPWNSWEPQKKHRNVQ